MSAEVSGMVYGMQAAEFVPVTKVARRRIEERAKKRAQAEQAEYERKVREREERDGSAKGPHFRPLDPTIPPDTVENLADPGSRFMRHNKRSAYEQAYNGQATVDADGSQLVLNAYLSQSGSDRNELVRGVRGIPAVFGRSDTALAGNGCLNEEQVRALEGGDEKSKINVLVSVHAEAKQLRRKHGFRPQPTEEKEPPAIRSEFVLEMKGKMEYDENRAAYRLRKQTVEPVFGTIKKWMGFTQFQLRGLEKAQGEWRLVPLAYNVKRLWSMKTAQKLQASPYR